MKKLQRTVIGLVGIWAFLAIAFTLSMYCLSHLESERIIDNGKRSLTIIDQEGDYPYTDVKGPLFRKDNVTDAVIIGISISSPQSYSKIERAMSVPYFIEIHDTTVAANLLNGIQNQREEEISDYGRYWQGYVTFVRPILLIGDIQTIRIINYVLLALLLLLSFMMIWRQIGQYQALFFLLSIMTVGFWMVPGVMQFSTCWYIALIGSLVFLFLKPDKIRTTNTCYILLTIGGITSFFDFLTTPVITFGFPILIVLLKRNNFPDWRVTLGGAACWCMGYFGLWASKWIISEYIFRIPVLANAMQAASLRSESAFSELFIGNPRAVVFFGTIVIALLVILGIFLALKRVKNSCPNRYNVLLAVSLVPIIWMMFFQNHTYVHWWFVWRILSVSLFSITLYIYYSLKSRNCG